MDFDEILKDPKYQAEFDKRIAKAIETSKTKWDEEAEAKRKELETDDTAKHGDIHPFQIPEFEELMYIAQQRRMYEQLEEKFRYGEWTIWLEKDKYNQDKIGRAHV